MGIETIRISELQDAAIVSNRDLVPINVYSERDGYTLTKKANIQKISNAIYGLISAQISIDNDLSALSHMDPYSLLKFFMFDIHNSNINNSAIATSLYDSLAISTYTDLGLGNLASTDIEDLDLDSYVKKIDANFARSYPISSYIVLNGILQVNGKITNVDVVNLKNLFPVDELFNVLSENPIKNSVLTNEFSKVVYKDDVNANYLEITNNYVTGLRLKNGKITEVYTRKLPELPIDDFLSQTSINPVLNKIITNALSEKILQLDDKSAYLYVKKSEANSIQTAPTGQYISSIQQTNGKIEKVNTTSLPSSTNVVDNGKYITGITQVDGKITEVKTENLPTISHSISFGKYITGITQTDGKITSLQTLDLAVTKVDTEMSLTSKNPVENLAITKKLNEILAGIIIPADQVLLTLNLVYPIGSIFLTTTNVCPLQSLGIGIWQKIEGGYALWTGNGSNGNTNIAAGLPTFPSFSANTTITNSSFSASGSTSAAGEHTHTISVGAGSCSCGTKKTVGNSHVALNWTPSTGSAGNHTHSFTLTGRTAVTANTTLNISGINNLYGKSTTVLPPAYVVNVFRRIG